MEQISSTKNEYIKSLCKLKQPSARRETGLFLAEGAKLCAEAMRSGLEIVCFLATEAEAVPPGYTGRALLISRQVAEKLSSLDTAPGCFAVAHQATVQPPAAPRFILALDRLSDPANLGAVLRSAEAFGADLVFAGAGSVDLYSPKVLRAAMGSAFRMPVLKGDLPSYLADCKARGFSIYGAGLNRSYINLPDASFASPAVVVIGNEAGGISPEVMAACDRGLFIPMLGENESLNAAVAASIILWEQSKWR